MFLVQARFLLAFFLLVAGEAFAHRVDYMASVCQELVAHTDRKQPTYDPVVTLEDVLFSFGLKTPAEANQFFQDAGIATDALLLSTAEIVRTDFGSALQDSREQLLFIQTTFQLAQEILIAPQARQSDGMELHALYVRYKNLLGALDYLPEGSPAIGVLYRSLDRPRASSQLDWSSSSCSLKSLAGNPKLLLELNPYQIEYLGLEESSALMHQNQALKEALWPRASLVEWLTKTAARVMQNPSDAQSVTRMKSGLSQMIENIVDYEEAKIRHSAFRAASIELKRILHTILNDLDAFNAVEKMAQVKEKLLTLLRRLESMEESFGTDQVIEQNLLLLHAQKEDLLEVKQEVEKASDPLLQQLADEILSNVGRMLPQKP
jgi:hypothetical protein